MYPSNKMIHKQQSRIKR